MNTTSTPAVFPPISEILPHRDTMLFIDAITNYTTTSATCTYQPRADAWYADTNGAMPAWMGIEIMAQAIAAQVSLGAKLRGVEPKLGALLGSSNFRSAVAAFSPLTPLAITACLEFRDDSGLGAYECRIESKGKEVASATLKVFEPENFDQFIATGTTTS